MSNEDSGFGSSRRTPRQGIGGSPVGSWLTVGLAVVAVIVGFLILRNILDDGTTAGGSAASGSAGSEPPETDIPEVDLSIPAEETTTTTSTIPRVTEGVSVVVANANSVGGSAGDMTDELTAVGYTTVDPVNAGGSNQETSTVYYDDALDGAQQVAESVARDLGGLPVEVVETPAPTIDGDLGEAGVLVVLGDDGAGKTIADLSGSGDAAAAPEAPAGDADATPSGTTGDG